MWRPAVWRTPCMLVERTWNVDSALSRAVVCVTCHLGQACQSCCSNFHILSDVLSAWQVSRGERWLNLPLRFWISLRFQVGQFWFRTGYGIGASLGLWHLLEHWSFRTRPGSSLAEPPAGHPLVARWERFLPVTCAHLIFSPCLRLKCLFQVVCNWALFSVSVWRY